MTGGSDAITDTTALPLFPEYRRWQGFAPFASFVIAPPPQNWQPTYIWTPPEVARRKLRRTSEVFKVVLPEVVDLAYNPHGLTLSGYIARI